MNLLAHPQGHVFYRKMNHARPVIAYGQGIYLYDSDGKRYIDGSGGPLVVNVGHGRPELVAAMASQAQAAAYIHAIMFTSQAIETFSDELADIVPIPNPRFYYLSSGSEVAEGAIKLARQIQMARGQSQRQIIISRTQSYHGLSMGALAASGRPDMRQPYMGMMHDAVHIAPPYPYRDPAGGLEAANRLEAAILAHGPENIAAFIAEPISGASLGAVAPPDTYWPRIADICRNYGVLFIADEVLVGLGRTGRWWAIDHWGVQPDILISSKGLAGGYFPLGFIASHLSDVEHLHQRLGDFNHGGTFSHHAVGAAVGLATLRILKGENLVEHSAQMGQLLGKKLHEALGHHPNVGDIRGRGLFWALELVKERQSKQPFPAGQHLAWAIWQRAFDLGLVVYYSQGCADGVQGDLIMLGPPLIINESQIDEMVAILSQAIYQELPL